MTWALDKSHSAVEFSVRHMMVSTVRGHFTDFDAEVELDPTDLTKSRGRAVIRTASIDTREEKRDAHLRSADFFDVEKYPEMVFESRRIEARGGNRYLVEGDLTIKEATQPVQLEVELQGRGQSPWGSQVAGFEASGKISREQFGLNWNVALEAGGWLVGDEIKIRLDVELSEEAERAA